MRRSVATDAQNDAFKLLSALKQINDNLTSRDVKALKFLCSDFISPRTMENINSALRLFDEFKKLEMSPCSIAELLYLIHQNRLISKLQYTVEIVKQIVDEGKGCCNPCRLDICFNVICTFLSYFMIVLSMRYGRISFLCIMYHIVYHFYIFCG